MHETILTECLFHRVSILWKENSSYCSRQKRGMCFSSLGICSPIAFFSATGNCFKRTTDVNGCKSKWKSRTGRTLSADRFSLVCLRISADVVQISADNRDWFERTCTADRFVNYPFKWFGKLTDQNVYFRWLYFVWRFTVSAHNWCCTQTIYRQSSTIFFRSLYMISLSVI